MKLPIYIYNEKVLTEQGKSIDKNYPKLSLLIEDMFETMTAASGIGLAAHQIGIPIKLFVINISHYEKGDDKLKDFKKVFINSKVIEEEGEEVSVHEGCLSIPGINIEIKRKPKIKLKYFDENFIEHEEWFDGLAARCILHEHDHTNGILFLKRISSFQYKLLESNLKQIIKRNFSTSYIYKK